MAIEVWFRHADRRVPFLWEAEGQPEGRWHAPGRGPVQYASDTPEGAWAEFLRDEAITDLEDLAGVSRSLWALEVEVGDERLDEPELPLETLTGDRSSYRDCQREAVRLRASGATGLVAQSAALLPATASGEIVRSGRVLPAPVRDGRTLCLFGQRPTLRGHRCVEGGRPPDRVVGLTRQFG